MKLVFKLLGVLLIVFGVIFSFIILLSAGGAGFSGIQKLIRESERISRIGVDIWIASLWLLGVIMYFALYGICLFVRYMKCAKKGHDWIINESTVTYVEDVYGAGEVEQTITKINRVCKKCGFSE
ncbi:MAG: hypothetical protein LBC82_08040 [Oscillospiraceae bacterium]|jgi:uncharacterized BrkB/YihY/UPF0761 family membrane protein|nr:hypothetical protein [Oscillospiraceae bacterium]